MVAPSGMAYGRFVASLPAGERAEPHLVRWAVDVTYLMRLDPRWDVVVTLDGWGNGYTEEARLSMAAAIRRFRDAGGNVAEPLVRP